MAYQHDPQETVSMVVIGPEGVGKKTIKRVIDQNAFKGDRVTRYQNIS